MLNATSIHTFEIDDISLACKELKAQLREKLPLLRNTVGIVQCDPEFIEAGILEPVYKELGIPLVGGTTAATATNIASGSLMFSILVLTSDDAEFAVSHTTGLSDDYAGAITNSLGASLAASKNQLRLALVFPPIIEKQSGDCYIDAFESVCGKVPIFGANPADHKYPDYGCCLAICNDKALPREMSYVLLSGEVNPRFLIAAVPPQANIEASEAVITRATDNTVFEINNMTAFEYMESLGLVAGGSFKSGDGLLLPLLVTVDNAENPRPFVRALIDIYEDGSAEFSGNTPTGAHIVFGSNNNDDVMSTTTQTAVNASGEKDVNAALIFSCIFRQIVVGVDSTKEFKQIQNIFPADIPFTASYVNGEFSPTSITGENTAQNRYHNYSLIICLL